MTFPFARHFDAHLPCVAAPVRITSLNDAQVFMRRWIIRDKDRSLKVLLRTLERANSGARVELAMQEFRRALAAHALLPRHTWASSAGHQVFEKHRKEQP
ncbi:MAG TPA: hypothetical protein VFB23_04945 [Candidatus Acidoferrales bacterium]|nr:hypothetical protein [Candidatus Acidoferrales bacterium]